MMWNSILKQVGVAVLLALSFVSTVVAKEAPMLNERLVKTFEAEQFPGLHGVLVIHQGEIIAEAYFPGEDERWGTPLGVREHGPQTLHDLRSVTKSIVSLLYGIALAEGKVPDVDAPLIEQFPDYRDLAEDPRRRKILIRHALSMQMGTEWNEELPYSDPRNSEIAMEKASDRYRFVLDRPMVNEPGKVWTYNGGATALIAKLIEAGVGMPIDDYARTKLFAPLGISEFEWIRGADGVPSAASGLRLKIHDLAKIGTLIARDGKFDGKQIVPAKWLSRSFKPRAKLDELRYGYFWWLAPWGDPPVWVGAFGNGGQRLAVMLEADVVVVVFAGNYNQPDAWRVPVRIIEGYVVPAVQARMKKE